MAENKKPLWAGVFSRPLDETMRRFNASIGFDGRLYREDIQGSVAYAHALKKAGIITARECARLEKGLGLVEQQIADGKLEFTAADEDIHMAVESALGKFAGETAGKLHTGRSRNEQVVVDERLYIKKRITEIIRLVADLQQTIVEVAERHIDVIMPGYTHLQQGQLVRFPHYLMALFFMLERDRERLRDCGRRCDVLPLGSGALAGNALGLDRKFLAQQLGFARVSPNSIDAVSDRDFIVEFLAAGAILSVHLSRYAEDLIIWSSAEFGFVQLDDRFATGSSLMPQKKNPDSLELVRGKSGRVCGNLNALLMVMKGLPLTYAKDLQEDKEPLFDTVDTIMVMLKVFRGALETMQVRPRELSAWVKSSIYATDLVEAYVRQGMPFRQAHETVGHMVKDGTFDQALKDAGIGNPQRSVERKNRDGGTSLASVRSQIKLANKLLRTKNRSK
jgi:argininosuccinate lyase